MSDIHEKDIIELIDEKYLKMSKSHKKIAQFIKEHYDQAVFMTAAKIGGVLDISPVIAIILLQLMQGLVVGMLAGLGL